MSTATASPASGPGAVTFGASGTHGLPLPARNPVADPFVAFRGYRPVFRPARAAEDGAHGMVGLAGGRLDDLSGRVLEQPVREEGEGLAAVPLAAGVLLQCDAHVERSRRQGA